MISWKIIAGQEPMPNSQQASLRRDMKRIIRTIIQCTLHGSACTQCHMPCKHMLHHCFSITNFEKKWSAPCRNPGPCTLIAQCLEFDLHQPQEGAFLLQIVLASLWPGAIMAALPCCLGLNLNPWIVENICVNIIIYICLHSIMYIFTLE